MTKCDMCFYPNKKEATWEATSIFQTFYLCEIHAKNYPHKNQLKKIIKVIK